MAAAIVAAATCGAAPARAQSTEAAAEALFQRARELVAEGRYTEACPKFAESHRLDPGVGILLFLADCYEKTGRIATAWAMFEEAGRAARARGQPKRVKVATDRAGALAPRLPRLTLDVAEPVEGQSVLRDGAMIGRASWGAPIPVDPGRVTVASRAPGHEPWSVVVELIEGTVRVVTVPRLHPLPAAASSPPGSPHASRAPTPPPRGPTADADHARSGGWSAQKTAGVVLGGVGLAGVVAGGVLGVLTIGAWDEARAHCEGPDRPLRCDDVGVREGRRARALGRASTISFVVGGVALGSGIVLWLADRETSPRAQLRVTTSGAELAYRAKW